MAEWVDEDGDVVMDEQGRIVHAARCIAFTAASAGVSEDEVRAAVAEGFALARRRAAGAGPARVVPLRRGWMNGLVSAGGNAGGNASGRAGRPAGG